MERVATSGLPGAKDSMLSDETHDPLVGEKEKSFTYITGTIVWARL